MLLPGCSNSEQACPARERRGPCRVRNRIAGIAMRHLGPQTTGCRTAVFLMPAFDPFLPLARIRRARMQPLARVA